jgi:hypothetical protein
MSIIEKEARERAAKTEHLRQLRLAAEAQAKFSAPAAAPRMAKRSATPSLSEVSGRRIRSKRAP